MAETTEKLPPQALEAEQAVIGAMLLSREAIDIAAEILADSFFYRPAHRKIFRVMIDLYDKNEPADLITVSHELTARGQLEEVGGRAYLASLTEATPGIANIEHHSNIIIEKATLNRLIESANTILTKVYDQTQNVDDILDSAEHEIFSIKEEKLKGTFTPLGDILPNTFKEIELNSQREGHLTGVPTGFKPMDDMTSGFQKSDLVIVASRPSVGKTSLSMNVIEHISVDHKIPAIIFSLEMSKEQLAQRLLCSRARISSHLMRTGRLADEQWTNLSIAVGPLSEAPIFIDDTPSMTVLEMRAKARRLKTREDIGLIVIDYLQLIQGPKRAESRQQEVSYISRSLKAMARELNVPVIALSQLSRQVELRGKDAKPQLSDLRESGCLTKDTQILRADTNKYTTIEELLKHKDKRIPVWTIGDNFKLKKCEITNVFYSGRKTVYKLSLKSGKNIKASGNHPFLTYKGWKRLDELSPGERLATPRRIGEPDTLSEWSQNRIILLAHMIGDGSFVKRQPIRYATTSKLNANAVRKAVEEFDISVKGGWDAKARSYQLRLSANQHLTRGVRNPIAKWLDEMGLFGCRSYEKFIPEDIFMLDDNRLAVFLQNLWATDGHIGFRKVKNTDTVTIHYSTNSRLLADDVSNLLLRFGIITRIGTCRKKGYRDVYMVILSDSVNKLKLLSLFDEKGLLGEKIVKAKSMLKDITHNTNIDTIPIEVWNDIRLYMKNNKITTRQFARKLEMSYCGTSLYKNSPSRQRLSKIATILQWQYIKTIAQSDLFWDTIESIEVIDKQPVYDLTIEGTHNFVANGIIVHNSIEQDADVVMFIHRPRDEAGQWGTEAEIILAKQRNGPTGKIDLVFVKDFARFELRELYHGFPGEE